MITWSWLILSLVSSAARIGKLLAVELDSEALQFAPPRLRASLQANLRPSLPRAYDGSYARSYGAPTHWISIARAQPAASPVPIRREAR